MQVAPIQPVLKSPGNILLKPRCDGLLSNVAFTINLRRHIKGKIAASGAALAEEKDILAAEARAYTRPFLSSP